MTNRKIFRLLGIAGISMLISCGIGSVAAEETDSPALTETVVDEINQSSNGLIVLQEAVVEEREPEQVFRPEDLSPYLLEELPSEPEITNIPEPSTDPEIPGMTETTGETALGDELTQGSSDGDVQELPEEESIIPDDGFRRNSYLLDQDGNKVTLEQYKGKIVLLTFFYMECRYGHCPLITKRMNFISRKFPDRLGSEIQLVSISFDPDIDTVSRLREYSAQWESDPSRWAFLTGEKGDIVDTAMKYGIIFLWNQKDNSYDHSVRTFLLDKSGDVARVYKGMNYNIWEVINDIKVLLQGRKLEPLEVRPSLP